MFAPRFVDVDESGRPWGTHINHLNHDALSLCFEWAYNDTPAPQHWVERNIAHKSFHRRNGAPIVLSSVCSYWRRTCRAIPGAWNNIRVILSPRQNITLRPYTLFVHNQAEVDLMTQLSGQSPIRLSFAVSKNERQINTPGTAFSLGDLFTRVDSILLDMSCDSLIQSFSCVRLPNLTSIHVGMSDDFLQSRWKLNQRVANFLQSQLWTSNTGVKRLVWDASSPCALDMAVDWSRVTEIRLPTPHMGVTEWDLLSLLDECTGLKTLQTCLDLASDAPARLNRSEMVAGPLPTIVRNKSLVEFFVRQEVMDRTASSLFAPTPILSSLALPSLTSLALEVSMNAPLWQIHYLTNPAIIGTVERLQLTRDSVTEGHLAPILRGMHSLVDLTLACLPVLASSSDITYRCPGIDDDMLKVIQENAPKHLKSFTVFGESWLSQAAISNFAGYMPYLESLRIEVWGGADEEDVETLRRLLEGRGIGLRCAKVGPCKNRPGYRPPMVHIMHGWGAEPIEVDPNDSAIVDPNEVSSAQTVCSLCEAMHIGRVIDSKAFSVRVLQRPDVYM